MSMNKRLAALEQHQARLFKRFLAGGIVLIGSLITIFMINLYLPASQEQEIYAMIALLFASVGGLVAFSGYIGLIWIRIKYFMERN